jgi:short-subunit dehydrogenase
VGVYSASKFGVEALAQANRYELRSLGIDVTIVQPRAFPSNLSISQRLGADEARAADYAEVIAKPFTRPESTRPSVKPSHDTP